jgi:hypothetical protein
MTRVTSTDTYLAERLAPNRFNNVVRRSAAVPTVRFDRPCLRCGVAKECPHALER